MQIFLTKRLCSASFGLFGCIFVHKAHCKGIWGWGGGGGGGGMISYLVYMSSPPKLQPHQHDMYASVSGIESSQLISLNQRRWDVLRPVACQE